MNLVKVIDISMFSANEYRGYNTALLIGMVLSSDYTFRLSKKNIIDSSEFSQKERNTDELVEWTADYITSKGYKVYAQSKRVLYVDGFYNEDIKSTPLPHKTIAVLAGLGWIGKNNLLVVSECGSTLSVWRTATTVGEAKS